MKIASGFLVALILVVASGVQGAERRVPRSVAEAGEKAEVEWYRAQDIGVEGKGWDATESYFHRLPAKAQGVVRDPVWSLSQNSAGLCLRFATDSTSIHARWTVTSKRLAMPHMPATGVSGVDLYVRTESGWRWLAEGQPREQSNTLQLVGDLSAEKRDYLLYFPLYNGLQSLELGLKSGAALWQLSFEGEAAKPIVFWGTSITHGASASRTGMPHPAILGRRFERPVINLGFSGNGRMEPEVARLVAEIDAAVYVVDCLPNLSGQQVRERARTVVDILRAAHPSTPILLVEDRTYADAFLVTSRRKRNEGNREALRETYQKLQADGVPAVYYLEGEKLLGADGEDTVDGSHPTDLGFFRQANAFEEVLAPILAQ